jgi:formate dehydrogenase subunit beta
MAEKDFELHGQSYKTQKKYLTLEIKKTLGETLNDVLIRLVTGSELEAILMPQELPEGQGVVQTLVTSPDGLITGNLIAPVMPVNSAKLVSDITRLTPSTKKLAVVLKPCEYRALIELIKLQQASLDNIIVIGLECPGTFTVLDYEYIGKTGKSTPTDLILKYLQDQLKNEPKDPELRSACQNCEYFIPENVDISINLIGLDLKKSVVFSINTIEAQKLFTEAGFKLEDSFKDQKNHDSIVTKLNETRLEKVNKLLVETQDEVKGLDNLSKFFAKCINCHNCMTVCPICYCKECFFESSTFDYESEKFFKWSDRKGTLRMPNEMFLYHLGRFNHMVLSCVACGMCEQGCPSGIPLLKIYKTVGLNAQKVFDYVPGRNVDEPIPVLAFKEEELEPR